MTKEEQINCTVEALILAVAGAVVGFENVRRAGKHHPGPDPAGRR